ncbi:MAG: helix-turn-helix transcriptional regulator [Nocardioidaceae bacterium]
MGRAKTPFVGRTAVLEQLRGAVAAAEAGVPTFVVVEGEAGIGKSRLVAELTAGLPAATRTVLTGHCTAAAGRHLPFGPWIDALRDLVRQAGPRRATAWAGPGLPVLARLVPELAVAREPDAAPRGAGTTGTPSAGLVYEAVAALLGRAAEHRPTVLVLEDLHWSDASSRELLDHLTRVVREERLLVLVTTRTDEPRSEDLRAFLGELRHAPHVDRLVMTRLPRDEVARQVAGLREAPATEAELDRLMSVSEGVPFLVEEAVTADVGGQTSLGSFAQDLVGYRLDRLDGPSRALTETAAIGLDPLHLGLLAAAGDLPAEDFDAALREAIDRGVLELDPSRPGVCRFRHALLREAARSRLFPGRQTTLHGRWARVLTQADHIPVPARATALAVHFSESGDAANALAACLRAAGEARRIGAYPEQAGWLDRAVRFWPRVSDAANRTGVVLAQLQAQAAEAWWRTGELARAEALVDAALRELGAAGAPALRGWLGVLKAWIEESHDRETPVSVMAANVALVPREPASVERARAVMSLAQQLGEEGRPEEGLTYADEAWQTTSVLGDAALDADALSVRALLLSALGRDDEALAALDTAERLSDSLELRVRSELLNARANVHWFAGRVEDALAASAAGARLSGGDRPGAIPQLWGNHTLNCAESLMDLGRWDEAAQAITTVERAEGQPEWVRSAAGRLRWHLAAWRGELDHEPWCRLDPAVLEAADPREVIQDMVSDRYTRADVAALTGEVEAVRGLVRPVLEHPGVVPPAFMWPVLEVAARVEGDVASGSAPGTPATAVDGDLVGAVEGVARGLTSANPRDRAFALTVGADLARARGGRDPAAWADVVRAWREAGFPHRRAWAALRLGEAAAETDRGRAREALVDATDVAIRLGARPLEETARKLARRHRVPLSSRPRPASSESGLLTEREREVLALIAEGCTNRQIADRLFISTKTASVHVSNILAKLGAGNRGQAAALARRRGWDDAGNPWA